MSWFGARSHARGSAPAPTRAADDLAAELEQQARAAGDRQPAAAAELLRGWLEQSEERAGAGYTARCGEAGEAAGTVGAELRLGFRDVLLRSRAFEALLESCARARPLREEALRRGGSGGAALGDVLATAAERLLLPGAALLWPGLLEALMADSEGRSRGELCWEHWARRVLAGLKRAWQHESLPAELLELDRRLIELAAGRKQGAAGEERQGAEAPRGAEELLRQGGARASKQGIRAALAMEQLRLHTREAARLRERAELLFGACARLAAVAASGAARAPKLRRLLQDADDALRSLDDACKALHVEQEALSASLGDIGGELARQISGVQMTRHALFEKRVSLEQERKAVLQRLEEIDTSMADLGEQAESFATQERQLQEQLRGTTSHFEDKIGAAIAEQRALSEQKLRAVTFKESGCMALDVVDSCVAQQEPEVRKHLRKRRLELSKTLTALARAERLRLGDAGECIASPENAQEVAAAFGPEAWEETMRPLREGCRQFEGVAEASDGAAEAAAGADGPAGPGPLGAGVGADLAGDAEDATEALADQAPEDLLCADCGERGADWASVSFGVRLCLACAGHHRGFGVHVSFVRSVAMDKWSPRQLRRMRLGGNARFLEFLAGYPQLDGQPARERYHSRAAAYYRRQLQARCDGAAGGGAEAPPPPEEGALRAELAPPRRGEAGAVPEEEEPEEGAEEAVRPLEEEVAALEAAREGLLRRLGAAAP